MVMTGLRARRRVASALSQTRKWPL